jgi:transposase InsO family protein
MISEPATSRTLLGIFQPIMFESHRNFPRTEAGSNARRSLDFVHDQFAAGRRFRTLNLVDDVTRECLAAIPHTSISGRRVARELTRLVEQRGKPGMIVSDNGAEFTPTPCWPGRENTTLTGTSSRRANPCRWLLRELQRPNER